MNYRAHTLFILLFLANQVQANQWQQTPVAPALQALAVLTVLSLAPSILMVLTSFTRIIIVLSLLRNALGLQQTPPNSVLISLALFLSLLSMMPIAKTVYDEAFLPYQIQQISGEKAIVKALVPLKQFMLKQTREKDLQMILQLTKETIPQKADDIKLHQLVPAFLLSELQTAFQIGFIIFLPFLLIDLIVTVTLMTLGMLMIPPMTISLPIKLLVFVLVEGWSLVAHALIASFH